MKFIDHDVKALDMNKYEDFAKLFIQYLCGKLSYSPNIIKENKDELEGIINHITRNELNYEQLNEILILLNENRISEDFFEFFFNLKKDQSLDFKKLKKGITRFRGYCFLGYGNITKTFQKLSKMSKEAIELSLNEYITKQNIKSDLINRPAPIINIRDIDKDKTWYLGYFTGKFIKKQSNKLKELLRDPNFPNKTKFESFGKAISTFDKEIKEIREIGKKNARTYLNWDYMDVYIATSMREKKDFEETFEFLETLKKDPEIESLNIRFFDPTQSYTRLPRPKGLIEGLMLKRAVCTIYMVQEHDTLGKDSELAATLAQKKPVIAYIPDYPVSDLIEKIKNHPLEYIKKMILNYLSEDVFEVEKFSKLYNWSNPQKEWERLRNKLFNFLIRFDKYRMYEQCFELWEEEDEKFKKTLSDFDDICEVLANGTKIYWDKRADNLKNSHPLGMQIDIDSGVSNGVLVVRDFETCKKVLIQILTKSMEFEIRHVEKRNEYGFTGLYEKNSDSLYRIITDDPHLTNSFWNFFYKSDDK